MKKIFTVLLGVALIVCSFFAVGCKKDGAAQGKVSLHYYNEASDIVPMILSGQESIGLIPEPAVSNLETKAAQNGKTLYRISLQELYDSESKSYPQAVLMVKNGLLATHPEVVAALSGGVTAACEWLTEQENIATAVNAVKGVYESSTLSTNMKVSSVAGSNIFWQSAADAVTSVNKYIGEIRELDAESANLPDESFYYSAAAVSGEFTADTIKVAAPDGAPALALSKLIADGSDLGTDKTVNYKIVAAGNIAAEMATGSSDIVVIPVNAATKTYTRGGGYSLVAVITHGNFYIVSDSEITVADLKGKRIAVPQRGKVPDWTLRLALKNNGLDTEEI